MVPHGDLKSRVDVSEIVKAVFVQPVRGVNDLKASLASSSQEPFQIWKELNSLQLTFDVVVDLSLFRKEVVEEVNYDERRTRLGRRLFL
jgi:hypothetical protein